MYGRMEEADTLIESLTRDKVRALVLLSLRITLYKFSALIFTYRTK